MPILYSGLDVSLELTIICVITAEGSSILKEAKVASDPEAISSMLLELDGSYERIGLEARPLSQWLFFGLRDAGLPVCCIETRHSKAVIAATSLNKTDRNDARSMARLVRSGWFKTVHVKSVESQELRRAVRGRPTGSLSRCW
ncbi:IS110 family transposase [Xanthobacter versatilis]|uniref:IS110 family transposase n=1 Tax=Xanthobacter autotrophicus (strain ATCC BAA-1158 / Py2) TaxID=78245 RepID=UPI0037292ED4